MKSELEELKDRIDSFFGMNAVELMVDFGFCDPTVDDLLEAEELFLEMEPDVER